MTHVAASLCRVLLLLSLRVNFLPRERQGRAARPVGPVSGRDKKISVLECVIKDLVEKSTGSLFLVDLFQGPLLVFLHPFLGLHEFAFFEAVPELWLVGFDAGARTLGSEADVWFTGGEVF